MNLYNFVYSEGRSDRFKRHLVFWMIWFIYLIVTYLIPTNWIPAWNFKGPIPHIHKYGVGLSILRILMAGFLHTLLHMALVYGILYYFLPKYLTRNRNKVSTTLLLCCFVSLIAFLSYFNFVLALYISTRIGYFTSMPGMQFIVPLWGRQILFNFPTVIGFALGIKLLKNWFKKQEEVAQATREKTNAELQLLKSQVHPHFLFNTLNNIYSFIINESPAAPDAIRKLCNLLRYIIHECNEPLVKLDKELRMIKGYIDLEKIRYGDNLNLKFEVSGTTADKTICPLILIPFVENSFKHGASQMLAHAWVNVAIKIEDDELFFNLSNGKPVTPEEKSSNKGLGLTNVKKRLAILYPETHSLSISDEMMIYSVSLKIPLYRLNENETTLKLEKPIYEPI